MLVHGLLGIGVAWILNRLADRELKVRRAAALKIGHRITVVVSTAVLFVAFGHYLAPSAAVGAWSVSLEAAAYWFCVALSVLLSVIDLRTHLLPNRFVLPAFGITGVLLVATAAVSVAGWDALWRALAAGCSAFAVLFILCVAGGLGFGDVKLGAILGAYCGWLGWGTVGLGFVLSFLLGGVVSLVLVLTRRASAKSSLPFGPWLCLGAILAMLITLASGA